MSYPCRPQHMRLCKCYVTLFSWTLDPHPPPRNTNNVDSYTSVTLFPSKILHPTALRYTRMAPKSYVPHQNCFGTSVIVYDNCEIAQITCYFFFFLYTHIAASYNIQGSDISIAVPTNFLHHQICLSPILQGRI